MDVDKRVENYLARARKLSRQGEYEEAIATERVASSYISTIADDGRLERVALARVVAERLEAQNALGEARTKYTEALLLLDELAVRGRERYELLHAQGMIYARLGQSEAAVMAFEQALDEGAGIGPGFWPVANTRIVMSVPLRRAGRVEDAQRRLQEARSLVTELDPPGAKGMLARIEEELGATLAPDANAGPPRPARRRLRPSSTRMPTAPCWQTSTRSSASPASRRRSTASPSCCASACCARPPT